MVIQNDIIDESEVRLSPRGRKPHFDPELIEILSKVEPGKALRLAKTIGQVDKKDQASCAAILRRHWRAIRNEPVRIDFSDEGFPQVRLKR